MARAFIGEQTIFSTAGKDRASVEGRVVRPVKDVNARIVVFQQDTRDMLNPDQSGHMQAVISIHDDAGVFFHRDRGRPSAFIFNLAAETKHVVQVGFFR